VKIIFSTAFKSDLLEAETRYAAILPRLGDDFHRRVREVVTTIINRRGGDHIGPHGFPVRKCRPFPYLVCYQIDGDALYVLALVHERRHPDHLQQRESPPERP